jgi:Raf kinase inhibitor-like YbhB/YbcL family protein
MQSPSDGMIARKEGYRPGMPEPGSHAYDVQRSRLRSQLEDEGINDQHADEEANRRLRGDTPHPSPSMETERAGGPAGDNPSPGDPGSVLELRSSAFNDNSLIAARHAKDGGNEPPELEWSPSPEGTRELALLVADPDAPTGTFLHWLVTGIDARATSLDGSGTQHENGFGERGYGGPLPPVGDEAHRYVFRIYALADPFAAPDPADADAVRAWLDEHALATGTITALYQR